LLDVIWGRAGSVNSAPRRHPAEPVL